MLPTGFPKQPANVVFDERQISNIHIAREQSANSSVAARRSVGKNLCRWLDVERSDRTDWSLVRDASMLANDLRCVGETISELRFDG
jgi:hypothetical protein